MTSLTLPIFLLILTTFTVAATTTATKTTNSFIKSKCSSTSYPKTCVQSLSYYAETIKKSPRQMAQVALLVGLSKARYAKTYVTQLGHTKGLRPKEVRVLKDCIEEIDDSVDRLGKSVHEFQVAVRSRARSRELKWRMSNVLTWTSDAITDINTCIDETKDLNWRFKSGINGQLVGVMQCTSNALALVNQFANKYFP